ncbi:[FeFe] hydrogenase H-cluster radical SAM maturase HydG [Niameybacter massiliensis]|uniref:[FeFe] hydrogenase H-cluster radical SAM maturase HydG n=1 Tax=Holtiella tumoricola TaxID=3018743 RepID=A0AA42DJQ2_9FIRM|nr:[FeFe] hydrogenase H-cluster radical SAM maturase HydG [Holtiella tumoricola]MDA3730282.1 [FeFe] hydrogenase H-cluster radical SAM maturase HydG [Holtiella tumoricola]
MIGWENVNWSECANEWFEEGYIYEVLDKARDKASNKEYVTQLIEKAANLKGLTHKEASVLLMVEDEDLLQQMKETAKQIKEDIYGKRVVLFAPLYVSDYCVNGCEYCGYKHSNCELERKKLTMEELKKEVQALEELGHKRLALELGEDPVNNPIEYVLECIDTIYQMKFKNGQIRRINVNIAATTIEEYKMLKEAQIGTYILFQETYHRPTYESVHPKGPKHNYSYHTSAFHRAMLGGIDDVGFGVLYGLYDYRYETVAMLMHAEKLEQDMGVGPHTISVPRIKAAENVETSKYPGVSDENFKHIVMVLRLAVPYTGLIISTREDAALREEALELGISQMSAGSCTAVGGYQSPDHKPQFEVDDHRSPAEVIKDLLLRGYIPSYCTACYRQGRTGDRFMRLAKTGQIGNICTPNALLTLNEYLEDYGDEKLKVIGKQVIKKQLEIIQSEKARAQAGEWIERINAGERDFRF